MRALEGVSRHEAGLLHGGVEVQWTPHLPSGLLNTMPLSSDFPPKILEGSK